jgi:hypothetical protein
MGFKVFADYSIAEMDQSWRMEKIDLDLKFALTSDNSFFSPTNMGRISRKLGEVGYKNTELNGRLKETSVCCWTNFRNSDVRQYEELHPKTLYLLGLCVKQRVPGAYGHFSSL